RADGPVPKKMDEVDLYMMPSYGISDISGAELIARVKEAQVNGTVATLMFHSVGGGYLNVSAEAHRELLEYLKSNEEVLWVDTFGNVCKHIRSSREND
ncbi:MAG: polysaccharide deacetylase, partial [Cyclobacteriaceae bacterium]